MRNGKKEYIAQDSGENLQIRHPAPMKKYKKICIATGIIAVIALLAFLVTDQMKTERWYVNGKTFQWLATSQLTDGQTFNLSEETDFDWDEAYSFAPGTEPEEIYEIVGYRWADITKMEGNSSNQIVFLWDERVVCYVSGGQDVVGYYLDFGLFENGFIRLSGLEENLFQVEKGENSTILRRINLDYKEI